jgi:hypothetical protein
MFHGITRSPWLAVVVAGLLMVACGAERPNVAPDTEPPEVTVVSDVPLFTRDPSLTLKIQASDLMGVKHVWYSVNNGSPIEVTMSAPQREGALSVVSGRFEAGLVANTQNVLAIWAEDYEGNSGVSGQPPYMTGLTIIQDDTALAVSLNGTAQATYYDESKMTVGTAVPPVYDRNRIGLEVVMPGETIHKASTRLASRTLTTSPGDLEGANPDNLPWLQFAVSLTGSPVATATYTIEATAGSTKKTYSGDLLPWRSPESSPKAMTGTVNFNLPLDSVRIPMLTTAREAVELKVTVQVTDEAGNQGGDEASLEYAVIGPPLNIVVDTDYAESGDLKSTFPYKITNSRYDMLFNDSDFTTFEATQQVRLARLTVTNPGPQPVALDVSSITGGSWSMTEIWTGHERPTEKTARFNDRTCPADSRTATSHLKMYDPGDGLPREAAPDLASIGWSRVAATSNLSTLAELRGSGVSKVGGGYIVPAAEGSAPGELVLYVTRPLVVGRSGAPAMHAAPYENDVGTLYTYDHQFNSPIGCCAEGQKWVPLAKCHGVGPLDLHYDYCVMPVLIADTWVGWCRDLSFGQLVSPGVCGTGAQACPFGKWLSGGNAVDTVAGPGNPCTNCTDSCSCSRFVQAQEYKLSTYYRQLSGASEDVAGAFAPVTQPTDDAGNVYGVANNWAESIPIRVSFTH